jgi:hypothetical protein
MWLEEVVNRMRLGTADYLAGVLYHVIAEYVRQRLYMIGGSFTFLVWDGFDGWNAFSGFHCPTNRSWPFVFLGPDETICLTGMLPFCQDPVDTEFRWHWNQLTRTWHDNIDNWSSVMVKALKVARPPKNNAERFSIFSFSMDGGGYAQQELLEGPSSMPIPIPAPPEYLCASIAPVYDARNDTIWALANTEKLFGYDINGQVWKSSTLPTKSRDVWAQLCISSCSNVLYVVGGCGDTGTIVDELNISTNTWKSVDIHDISVQIPAALKNQELSEINWNLSEINWDICQKVITVYDGELLYIAQKTGDGNSLSLAKKLACRSIISYNPSTCRRQLRAFLPVMRDSFTPLVI